MESLYVKSNWYIASSKEVNDKYPQFIIGYTVRISKYKNIFAKDHVPNWSEEVFVIKKIGNSESLAYVISDPKGEETVGKFVKKTCKKQIKKSLELKK